MNPKVSVIVPVYGAEAFLPTCISSLRAQTLRDIELIFVCDGSPDNSLAILRRVEPLDSRIRVIAFEENQGVSAARNAGLDAARGDYIGFCDGDDDLFPVEVHHIPSSLANLHPFPPFIYPHVINI